MLSAVNGVGDCLQCSVCSEVKPIREFRLHRRADSRYPQRKASCRSCDVVWRRKRRDTFVAAGLCKLCGKPKSSDRQQKNFCSGCNDKASLRRQIAAYLLKKKAIEYKGGQCVDCGLKTDSIWVYDFHHIDPNEKELNVGRDKGRGWEKLKPELDKCELVCSNCHRTRHFLKTYDGRGWLPKAASPLIEAAKRGWKGRRQGFEMEVA